MTPAERRALWRAAVVLFVSGLVRWGWERRVTPPPVPDPSETDLPELLERAHRERDEEEARRRPLDPGERLDPNTATVIDLDRLPGVGPRTADAIVTQREAIGGFATVDDLLKVPGIGSATLQKMRPHIEIRAAPRASARRSTIRRNATGDAARGDFVDVNRATEEELKRLPGIGPALASRILAERERRGRFASVEELLDVSGIGPATLERIRERVRIR